MAMGRPIKMNMAQTTSLVLAHEHRAAIKENIGDETVSDYIRDSILLRTTPAGNTEQEKELRSLKEELLKQAKQLKEYKQNEQKRSERYQADLERITTAFMLYIKEPKDPVSIRNWLMARIKNTDITLDEMYIHLRKEGFLE